MLVGNVCNGVNTSVYNVLVRKYNYLKLLTTRRSVWVCREQQFSLPVGCNDNFHSFSDKHGGNDNLHSFHHKQGGNNNLHSFPHKQGGNDQRIPVQGFRMNCGWVCREQHRLKCSEFGRYKKGR